jgi:hypothetical protein
MVAFSFESSHSSRWHLLWRLLLYALDSLNEPPRVLENCLELCEKLPGDRSELCSRVFGLRDTEDTESSSPRDKSGAMYASSSIELMLRWKEFGTEKESIETRSASVCSFLLGGGMGRKENDDEWEWQCPYHASHVTSDRKKTHIISFLYRPSIGIYLRFLYISLVSNPHLYPNLLVCQLHLTPAIPLRSLCLPFMMKETL